MTKTTKATVKKAGFTLGVVALGLIALNTMANRIPVANKVRTRLQTGF